MSQTKIEIPVLPNSRVVLRLMEESDLLTLHTWFLELDPERLTCRPISNDSLQDIHLRFARAERDPCQGDFAIFTRTNPTLIGRVRYFDLNLRNQSAELGYMLGPPYHKQGYGREAVRLLLGYLFNTLNLNKVMAQTGAFNTASIRLLEGLGFKEDGRLRQHQLVGKNLHDATLFSLLRDEFTVC